MASVLSHAFKKRSADAGVGSVQYTDEYVVRCEAGVTPVKILDYFRALQIAPGYASGTNIVCSSVSVSSSVLDGQLWSVIVRYESVGYAASLGGFTTPLDEPWQVRDGKTTISQVVSRAYASWIDGQDEDTPGSSPDKRIINTAGDPFDPPLVQDIILPTIEMIKNLSTSDYTSLINKALDDTVNASEITLAGHEIPKWGGKINIEGTTAMYVNPANGFLETYMQTRVLVTIHPQTWVRYVLNVGFRAIDPESGKLVRVSEKGYGSKRSDLPVKLDVDGIVLENEEEDPESGDWLAFLTYRAKSWSGNGFPSSLSNL